MKDVTAQAKIKVKADAKAKIQGQSQSQSQSESKGRNPINNPGLSLGFGVSRRNRCLACGFGRLVKRGPGACGSLLRHRNWSAAIRRSPTTVPALELTLPRGSPKACGPLKVKSPTMLIRPTSMGIRRLLPCLQNRLPSKLLLPKEDLERIDIGFGGRAGVAGLVFRIFEYLNIRI